MIVSGAEREAVVQNLKDAGLSAARIQYFVGCMEQENIGEMLRILEKHRYFLLDNVHEGERQISCLDFLVYEIRKKIKTGGWDYGDKND